jgi:hypothetical protein
VSVGAFENNPLAFLAGQYARKRIKAFQMDRFFVLIAQKSQEIGKRLWRVPGPQDDFTPLFQAMWGSVVIGQPAVDILKWNTQESRIPFKFLRDGLEKPG